ncbi:unnamed protein product, partial [Rotaria magnacalcarata]
SSQRLNSNIETAQYSSLVVNHHNRAIENELRTSNLSSESQRRFSASSSMQQSDENTSVTINNNASQLCRQGREMNVANFLIKTEKFGDT